ncbi:PREDICTED: glycylpeptide N-tetradecanoyltransferase 2-like [Amphimedon queenslandica]|uniref:Glycylpeptide N-tetradecanoyltransferase n=1 Tax=Amphimedon queenslandica TaxID=400682 RepID=A0A1X7VMH8_AMPQE|nr:PREDICTED: glycylpeptide N-tetradecanoyltransferase 2-like [Amphimedon queenslandica]|eukprot:XP_003383674.1 PREDICTED: glycylpeptide N-tetradecanoyltransferase 2-like [Amphimedon queenslandica]
MAEASVPRGEEGPEEEGETVETTSPNDKKKRKKKDKKGGARGAESSALPKSVIDESQILTTRKLQEIITNLSIQEQPRGHEFWDTQPVPKFDETVTDAGPIEQDKEHVRSEPFTLPDKFYWDNVDLTDDAQLTELYKLLNENYVEDDDNMFRFDYSCEFLRWALQPPGWLPQWHCGVRVEGNKKLVGFISAIPATVRIRDHTQVLVEINFLCVHKRLRSKRVAPVLIKEITRRVNFEGIFQAVYTAGILLPKPVAVCRYWHRSINPKKLVEVQFSSLHRRMTLQRMLRLYRLPDETKTPGLRLMEPRDVPAVHRLFGQYMSRFDLVPVFQTEEEISHWFFPRSDIVYTYVVEDPATKELTDFVSFYNLPSSVVNHPVHKTLKACYSFYNISTKTPFKELLYDALVLSKKCGADVFNALDIMDNEPVFEELKFGIGDGNLHYYLYNWKCPEIEAKKIGLVLQ